MKKNNFGKVFGLAAVAVFALVFGGCEDLVGKLTGKTLTGEVTITGTPKVGSQLTAEAETSATAPLVYAWQKKEAPVLGGGAEDEGTAPEPEWIAIEGATGATYTPVGDDIGHYVKVVVTAAGYSGALTKEADGTVTSGNLQGENGNGEGGNEGEGATPPVPVSGMYVLSTAGGKTAVADEGNTETGTAWTWALKTGEEPTAYFAVVKKAGQTVETGTGKDAAKVTVHTGIEDEVTEVDGTTPGETEVVVEVDMEDLLFDGTDENGKATRTFDLVVSETGKTPVTVTVNLELTLDAATDATIYYKDGGKWTKATEEDGTVPKITNQQATDCLALVAGPVAKLNDALAWVIYNAKSGTGNSIATWAVERFTEGYAEYRILVKADARIPRVNFAYPNSDYVSLELYGAGRPGQAEHKIAWDYQNNTTVHTVIAVESMNGNNNTTAGIFALYHKTYDKYKTLILEKNITIDGENHPFTTAMYAVNKENNNSNVSGVFYIGTKAALIMRNHSKITGVSAIGRYSPVYLNNQPEVTVGFYMQGGTIAGNTTGTKSGVYYGVISMDVYSVDIYNEGKHGHVEIAEGAYFYDNTRNDVTTQVRTTAIAISDKRP